MAFFGNRHLFISLICANTMIIFVIALAIATASKESSKSISMDTMFGMITFISAVLGVFISRLNMFNVHKFGLNAFSGILAGYLITTSFLVTDILILWCINILCIFASIIVMYKFKTKATILFISFIGSYSIFKSISLLNHDKVSFLDVT